MDRIPTDFQRMQCRRSDFSNDSADPRYGSMTRPTITRSKQSYYDCMYAETSPSARSTGGSMPIRRYHDAGLRPIGYIDENYRRIKTLGKGNFGKVYLAEHRHTKEKVAIKAVDKRNFKNEDQKIHAFNEKGISETFSMGLSHPNIVAVHEVFQDRDFIWIVMEYLEGGELFDRIKEEGRLSERDAKKWFREIVKAVDYIHRHHIVHRDLKPENILLDLDGNVRLCDFGFGKFCNRNQVLQTYCGSPFYAAPEMVTATPYIGPPADIWSCGVILYAMLSGKLPFQSENMPELFEKISNGQYAKSRFIPQLAQDVINWMLQVAPQDRATAASILQHPWLQEPLSLRDRHSAEDLNYLNIARKFVSDEMASYHQYRAKSSGRPQSLMARQPAPSVKNAVVPRARQDWSAPRSHTAPMVEDRQSLHVRFAPAEDVIESSNTSTASSCDMQSVDESALTQPNDGAFPQKDAKRRTSFFVKKGKVAPAAEAVSDNENVDVRPTKLSKMRSFFSFNRKFAQEA
ncbi:hypothetical protein BZG36_01277 [Bifiguratus adelaidae]|uniref:Protein kinase domain-containing protein n=1 Tax=Bifiguratus adelaidae TaxID=1938954 RepID=A0A261Y5A0_9FUNG|nr:hypothetical protein BZG36_01277 [Bifiguratus adelaidae]